MSSICYAEQRGLGDIARSVFKQTRTEMKLLGKILLEYPERKRFGWTLVAILK